jgi:hypothetical protein
MTIKSQILHKRKIKLPNMEKSVVFTEWYIYVGQGSVVLLSHESMLQSAIKYRGLNYQILQKCYTRQYIAL